jgi:hypothetical protein
MIVRCRGATRESWAAAGTLARELLRPHVTKSGPLRLRLGVRLVELRLINMSAPRVSSMSKRGGEPAPEKNTLFCAASRRLVAFCAGVFLTLVSPAFSNEKCGTATTIDMELQKAIPANSLGIGKITFAPPNLLSHREVQETEIFGSIFARALGEAVKHSTGGLCHALPKNEFPYFKMFLFSNTDTIDKEYCWSVLTKIANSYHFDEEEFGAAKDFFANNSLSRAADGRFHVIVKEHELAYSAFLELYEPRSVIFSLLAIEREKINAATYAQFSSWSLANKGEICRISAFQADTARHQAELMHRDIIPLRQSSGELVLKEVDGHRRTVLLLRIDAETSSGMINSVCRRKAIAKAKWPAFRRLMVLTTPRCSSLSLFNIDAWLMFEIPSEALMSPIDVLRSFRQLQSKIHHARGEPQTAIIVRYWN